MTLIDRNGLPVTDPWLYQQQDAPLVLAERCVIRLEQWDEYLSQFGAPAQGVRISGEQDPAGVLALLAQLEVIVIDFAKSREGRGFTLARLLRDRHAFAGDLRAAGPLLPDQFSMLLQCGFTSLLAPPTVPLVRWQDAARARLQAQARPRTLLERLSLSNEA